MSLLGIDGSRVVPDARAPHGDPHTDSPRQHEFLLLRWRPPPRRRSGDAKSRLTRRIRRDFPETAKLRPGFDVRVLDIGSRGVLIEAPTRLHIGLRVELTLFEAEAKTRLDLMGIVRRCHVASLSPIVYRGALEFSQAIEVQSLRPFLSEAALSA